MTVRLPIGALILAVLFFTAGAIPSSHALPANPARVEKPTYGATLGEIVIPRIGVRATVHEGDDEVQLSRGPGHYPKPKRWGGDLACQKHPIGIAGHRTTVGAWFNRINELENGDLILLNFLPKYGGRCVYEVSGRKIVGSYDWAELFERDWGVLAITACHPIGSASFRLAVYAFPRKKQP